MPKGSLPTPSTSNDAYCHSFVEGCPSMCVPWVLMASYLYYIKDKSLLSDTYFDGLCSYLFSNWDEVDHPHKDIVAQEDLKSGSLFSLKEGDYPLRVRGAANALAVYVNI